MTRGLVAAGHPEVAEAAAAILRAGGNAFDAAVGAGMAASIAEPGLTSLAGGGFLLARTARGEATLFDFFVDVPGLGLPAGPRTPHFTPVDVQFTAAVQQFHCGLGSVAVPGCLPGYLHVHRRLGRLPLQAVLAPAIRLARDGARLPPRQAAIVKLLEPIVTRTPEVAGIFAPDGRLLGEGERVRNLHLADFLEQLPAEVGRTGPVDVPPSFARAVLDAMAHTEADGAGGLVTAEDLTTYRVVERRPLVVVVRGHSVLTNPGPSFGGRLIAAALAHHEASGPLPAPGSTARAVALAQVMQQVDRRRAAILADGARPSTSRGTTHVSVADDEGNVAAMTTSNGEGSGDAATGTGITLNNMMGEDDLHPDGFHTAPPGTRVASMMAPTVVLGPGGEPVAVLGSGGSKRIRTAITQVLLNLLDGVPVRPAVEAPRLHVDGTRLEVEPGWPEGTAEALVDLDGIEEVNTWPQVDTFFGGVHAVVPGQGAAGDPRRDGATARA